DRSSDPLVSQLVSAKAGEGIRCLLLLPGAVGLCPTGQVVFRTGGFALTTHLSFSSKPRLLLLPVLCQRNLFSLLLVVQDAVPRDCLHQLLQALEQDSCVDPWVQALGDLLQQGPKAEEGSPRPSPLSTACQQQLRGLCQKIAQKRPEGQRKLNWCFSKQPGTPDSVPQGGKRKKASEESLELDNEREGKRLLLEEAAFEPLGPQECEDVAEVEEEVPEEPSGDTSAQSTDKAAQDSSQQNAAGELKKISQTELEAEVQSFVQVLGRVCCPLPASEPLQPDSHSFISFPSDARTGAENAAAAGVQSLRAAHPLQAEHPEHLHPQPARGAVFLPAALHVPRALPGAFLQLAAGSEPCPQPHQRSHPGRAALPQAGAEQTKLMCELVEECLEPHSVQLVLSHVLEVPLSEKLLPVLQAVLGRQEVLPPELLDLLVLTLCQQAPAFATSLNFARLVTAVLTVYQSQVSPAHRTSLATVLDRSTVALKKSLQAVLEGAR
uniref:FA complementation group E n=1 Tax=Serinus canaria TaxID=9135 RepID=A0A8C9UHF0_SERCA